jgi:hypothetical protein
MFLWAGWWLGRAARDMGGTCTNTVRISCPTSFSNAILKQMVTVNYLLYLTECAYFELLNYFICFDIIVHISPHVSCPMAPLILVLL